MKKKTNKTDDDDLLPEYDSALIRKGVRGKYVERYRAGTNIVLLDTDVYKVFKSSEAVNEALRLLIRVAEDSCSQKPRKPNHERRSQKTA